MWFGQHGQISVLCTIYHNISCAKLHFVNRFVFGIFGVLGTRRLWRPPPGSHDIPCKASLSFIGKIHKHLYMHNTSFKPWQLSNL